MLLSLRLEVVWKCGDINPVFKMYGYQRGRVGEGKDGLGVWEWQMQTFVYGMVDQRRPAVQPREIYSMFRDNIYRKGYVYIHS